MDTLYYIFLFITLYFQVFFLYLYLEDPSFYEKKEKDLNEKLILNKYPKVSIIVACWNEEDTITGTINSLLCSFYPQESLEIIIVDDGSTDDTWKKMQEYLNHKNIILLKKENGGKFTAINYAIPYASGDFIATVDADTLIEKNAIGFMAEEFLGDKKLSALGSTILLKKPKTLVQLAQSVEYQMFSFTKLLLARIEGALVVPGAFSMYRKEVFKKIGFFREAHLLEDLELTFRMQKAGLKVGQSKKAFAYTAGPENILSLFKQRLRWSYGFLRNAYDYRGMLKGKENFHFGFFTLPMSLFSYLSIPIVFISSWYYIIINIIVEFKRRMLIGWNGFFSLDNFFSLENFHYDITFFISIFILVIVFFLIYMGKEISRDNNKNPISIIVFLILYTFLVPFWVLKSFYKIIFAKKVSWR